MKANLMDETLFTVFLKEQGLKVSSMKTYITAINAFLKSNPDIDDSNAYHQYLVYSNREKSMYANFYALKLFIRFKFSDNAGIRSKLLDDLNTKEVKRLCKLKSNKKPYRPLSVEEEIRVLDNFVEPKHQIMFLIQLKTGVRTHDILSLTYDNFHYDVDNKLLTLTLLTKGDKPRTVFMYDDFAKTVMDYIVDNEDLFRQKKYVFQEEQKQFRKTIQLSMITSIDGQPIDKEYKIEKYNFNKYFFDFKQAFTAAGLDAKLYATHFLRKKFARKLWDKYHDVQKLQTGLGHGDPSTSLRYLRDSGQDSKDIFKDMHDDGEL